MEIVFWVMLGLVFLFICILGNCSREIPTDIHNDSRKGSFYEISNRKDK